MDQAILQFIQEHLRNGWSDAFFTAITFLGDSGIIWIAFSLCLVCSKTYRRQGLVLLVVLAITFLVGDVVLKNWIQRPRPFQEMPVELLIPPPESFSFPSGHKIGRAHV